MTPHEALVLDRFLMDACVALSWGGGGFTLLSKDDARSRLSEMMRPLLLSSSAMGAVAALAALPLQTAEIASGWTAGMRLDILEDVLLHTQVGRFAALEAVIFAAIFGAAILGYRRTAVSLAGLALCVLAGRGHVGAEGFAWAGAPIVAQAVHVLAASAWLGALVPFILLVPMTRDPQLGRAAIQSLRLFSWTGHGIVALVLSTGLANTLIVVGHLPTDPNSPYQFKLMLKIAAALVMTCLAVANRYIVVPMRRVDAARSARLLALGAGMEIALGATALALVASFGLDDPST